MTLRAAIYARRSTEEHQAESLDLQIENAKQFIARNHWELAPDCTFVDDAISRAEFKKRPGLVALLNAANDKRCDVIVTRDESRLGGDQFRTGIVIQDILDADVQLFYYFTEEEVVLDGAVSKFLVAARNFAAELEREKTAQRTREHLQSKARRGLNVGGRVFGYDNVESREGGRRTKVEYRINDQQAEIVRDIFRRYAEGQGVAGIAKELNARSIPSPHAGRRGSGSWSPSCIWAILRRTRYHGLLVWGRHAKTYRGGTKVRVPLPEDQWVKVEAPELKIVPDALWEAVQQRMEQSRRMTGRAGSRGAKPRYLLTGYTRCSECGGPIQVSNGKSGQKVIKVYGCSWYRNRGDAVCKNTVRRPVDAVDEAVVGWLKENVLSEALVAETLREVRRRLTQRAKESSSEIPELEREVRRLKVEAQRLAKALATTDEKPEAIVVAIAEREKRMRTLQARVEALKASPTVIGSELSVLEKEARHRLDNLREVLGRNPEEARKAVGALLEGPLTFTPVQTEGGKRYQIQGSIATGALFTTESVPNGI
jgi:site-specific DNA recombinase